MAAGLGTLMSIYPQANGTKLFRRSAVELCSAGALTSELAPVAVTRHGCSSVRLVHACSSSSSPAGTAFRGMAPSLGRRVQKHQQFKLWHGGEKLIQLKECKSVNVDDSAAADAAEAPEDATSVNDEQSSTPITTADEIAQESFDLEEPYNPRAGLEENFLVVNKGKFECRSCGYEYVSAKGDSSYPVSPGTRFGELPEDWRCPTCGAAKSFFEGKGVEVAGFVQNQGYGLGGNSLTESQKSLLIYGTLVFFFILFLSGYFLQ